MASPSASTTFDAPNADIILTSTDEVQFRVHKPILANASPVFEATFDLPQESSSIGREDDGELPIIPVSESSVVLDELLRFCYPSMNGKVSDLHTLRLLFAAAEKYDMKGVISQLAYILRYQFIDGEPHRAYAIACIYALWPEAILAGKQTLAHPAPGPSLPEYDVLPATMYHKLVTYRQKCVDVIDPILDDRTYNFNKVGMRELSWTGYACNHCAKPNATSPAYWFLDHLARTKAAFSARPRGASVSARRIAQDTINKHLSSTPGVQCPCRTNAPMRLVEFNERLAAVLDQKIAEIPFVLK